MVKLLSIEHLAIVEPALTHFAEFPGDESPTAVSREPYRVHLLSVSETEPPDCLGLCHRRLGKLVTHQPEEGDASAEGLLVVLQSNFHTGLAPEQGFEP